MATGIKLPITPSNGRMSLESGDSYIASVIANALGSGSSTNPFQQNLSRLNFDVFGINDDSENGTIKQRVKEAFRSLENDQLAQFVSVEFSSLGSERTITVTYKNLETGVRTDLDFNQG